MAAPLGAGRVRVDGDEAHHGRAVLRLAVGDAVAVADGDGRRADANVVTIDRHAITVDVDTVETVVDGPAALITIAVAVPKGDRFTDLVRGLTELGVGTIKPLLCARGEREPASLERATRVAAEALKQCRRGRLPQIGPACTLADLACASGERIVLDRAGTAAQPGAPAPVTLIVGPEGGLTDEELTLLRAGGVRAVRLARPILRIETAALAAAAVWASSWESCL